MEAKKRQDRKASAKARKDIESVTKGGLDADILEQAKEITAATRPVGVLTVETTSGNKPLLT